MKCPKCGADSQVRRSQPYKNLFVKRNRFCFNEHPFVSYEVTAGALDRRALDRVPLGIARNAVAKRRRSFVLKHPDKPALWVAIQLGITASRVKQIREGA